MQIGPYAVLGEIARGGMGVVYRARGGRGEDVALKLLLGHRANNEVARRRFLREHLALARLQHPNVVRILGAGEHEGSPWLALEFVEGQTLEDRLRRGPLPVWEALRVSQQLGQALSYVHSCGLLHRDLKPANVLLRGSQALLTDFGLVLDDQDSMSRITAAGVFQGTPGYWAPEQARGEVGEFGPWTDVYGLGAVLYACLTGRPPVQATSFQDYLQTIGFTATEPPRDRRPEVPAWLSSLCMRCLALDPGDRPRSVDDVTRALALAGESTGSGSSRRLAVVVAAALVALTLAGLLVWIRSTPEGPGPPPPAPDTRQPKVDAGSPAAELFALGSSAYDDQRYLEALDYCERAIELDPDHALAWSYRASAKLLLGRYGEAIEDYDRAIALNPRHAPALVGRGAAKGKLGRFAEALTDYDRALELDPESAFAYANRATCKGELKRFVEAIEDYDRALELNPTDAVDYAHRARCKLELRRYPGAARDLERALELDPDCFEAYAGRGVLRTKLAHYEEALEDFDRALELNPGNGLVYADRGTLRTHQGRYRLALEDFDRALESNLGAAAAELVLRRRARALKDMPLQPEERTPAARAGEALAEAERRQQASRLRRAGDAKAAAEDYAAAIMDFDRALELNPSDTEALTSRGESKRLLGQRAAAVGDYTRAIELDPRSARAFRGRGEAWRALGRNADAIEDYTRALTLSPLDASAYEARATARSNLGRYDEALADYSRAIELAPSSVPSYAGRGACWANLGRYPEAIADFDHALRLEPPQRLADHVRRVRAQVLAELEGE